MEQNLSKKTRTESDLIGSREVPESALYGVQTLRGIENFRISKFHLNEYPLFIQALAITKMGATIANRELDLLTEEQADAILRACKEILEGKHHEQFPVDMIQGGAGTTTNMNANEVIANRALELMGHQRGEYQFCSPNDHVNRSQSTNDAYPTAIHIGLYYTHLKLVKHLEVLIESFRKKANEFAHVIKMGRTQLEDAVPMTLGQTFNGFASILSHEIKNLDFALLHRIFWQSIWEQQPSEQESPPNRNMRRSALPLCARLRDWISNWQTIWWELLRTLPAW